MSVEGGGGDSHENPAIERIITEQFSEGHKLEQGSVLNLVSGIYGWLGASPKNRQEWGWNQPEKFLKYYEEDVRKRYAPKTADLIMEKSDPVAVAAFDKIINEMRANADRLLQEGASVAEPYLEKLRGLIK